MDKLKIFTLTEGTCDQVGVDNWRGALFPQKLSWPAKRQELATKPLENEKVNAYLFESHDHHTLN